jgi:uncharacterized protein YdhG (YjbR/CyaY superfamily)
MATKTSKQPAAKRTMTPTSVADYIATAPAEKRATLRELRGTIKAAAPRATERISYGIVGYKLNGKTLVHFGYAKAHYALYGTSEGTTRFPAERPLPLGLVTKIVKARRAAIEKATRPASIPNR